MYNNYGSTNYPRCTDTIAKHDVRCTDRVKINQPFPNIMTRVCPFDRNVEPPLEQSILSVQTLQPSMIGQSLQTSPVIT